MLESYKYCLYPNNKQKEKSEATLNTYRHLYNNALAERNSQSEFYMLPVEKHWLTYKNQQDALPRQKETNEYLPLVHSQVLQDVCHRVDKSFRNFFKRVKNHEKPRYPRFKGYSRYNSFTYPQRWFKIVGKSKLEHIVHQHKLGMSSGRVFPFKDYRRI